MQLMQVKMGDCGVQGVQRAKGVERTGVEPDVAKVKHEI